MTIEIHAEMPMCNLAETVHNKWLQQSGTKMTCLYEATLDNMIRFFMQIANYRTWLVKRSDGKKKKHDSMSSKLTAVGMCRDPKMLADAMKCYQGVEDVNIINNTFICKGFELFGSIKANSTYHRVLIVILIDPTKLMIYFLSPAIRQCIEKTLSYAEHGVAHTTFVLDIDCLPSKWHIARLPPNSAKRY